MFTLYIEQGRDPKNKGEIEMAILVNLDFRVTENNGGGLALAIKEDNQFIYIHSGYEGVKGQLIEDIKALFDGQHPSAWDGNELSEFAEYLEDVEDVEGDDINDRLDIDYWSSNMGVTVIMTKNTVYLSQFLGAAGQELLKNALGIDDIWESRNNSMPMAEFLALCK